MRQYHTIDCRACVTGIGGVELPNRYDYSTYQWPVCDDNHWRTPDAGLAAQYDQIAEEAMQKGDTVGGLISVVVNGVPVGWGEPVFSKLSAELGKAMLGINSVKGFEMGYGFEAARQKGSTFNDALHMKDGQLQSPHNKSGGGLGGISTGETLHFHVAFKPLSSIRMPQQTINADGQAVTLQIEGRHDVCAVPRAIPIVEALTLLVLADACLHHQLNKHD